MESISSVLYRWCKLYQSTIEVLPMEPQVLPDTKPRILPETEPSPWIFPAPLVEPTPKGISLI